MPSYLKASFLLCAIILLLCSQEVLAERAVDATINNRVTALQNRFNIPFIYMGESDRQENIHYEFLPTKDYTILNRYLLLFDEELSKYPPQFFSKRKIRSIALVKHLFRNETPTEGLYSPHLRMMLFDVSRSANNEARQRHSIHHEIFHMMALQLNSPEELTTENWSTLNVPGFVYGKQTPSRGRTNPNPVNRFAPSSLGFVTDYSLQSPPEDQAEIFACLMQADHFRLVNQWKQNDDFLNQKVQVIKAFVAAYDPDMSEEYWRQLHKN